MKRILSRTARISFSLLFTFFLVDLAWCAKPPTLSKDEEAARTLVRRALESEVAGDAQGRRDLLRQALDTAPDYPPANWHLGRVEVDGRWVAFDEAVRLAAGNEELAQYRKLREAAWGNPKRELALARWCARTRLNDESTLHYTRLVNSNGVDPKTTAEAMRALGLRNIGGRLVSEEELKRQQDVASEIERAMKRWRPQLQRWQPLIEGANDKRRNHAIEQMRQIDDPNVIPVLDTFLFQCGPQFGKAVVDLLAEFPEYEATQTLARYATLPRIRSIREEAVRQLKLRPIHEYVPLLLSGLASPIRANWSLSDNAFGTIRLRRALYREGPTENYAMLNDHFVAPRFVPKWREVAPPLKRVVDGRNKLAVPYSFRRNTFYGYDNFDDDNLELAALACLLEAQRQEESVAASNAATRLQNEPVFIALEQTTGKFHKRDLTTWCDWWQEYNEVHNEASSGKPTRYLYRRTQTSYDIYADAHYQAEDVYVKGLSCFLAGTKIWTQQGRVPIERIKIGDRVLSQDPDTGELSFQLVLNTTLRPPSSMIKVTVDGEDIFTTLGHPMWVSEKRWRMAKLLEVGDQLHGLSGIQTVDGIDQQVPMNEAYNLVVAGHATYFVGEKGILVHDNTYRAPTQALVPGLLPRRSSRAGLTVN